MFATFRNSRRHVAVLAALAMLASVLVAAPAVAAKRSRSRTTRLRLMRAVTRRRRGSLMFPRVTPTPVTSTVSPITGSPRALRPPLMRR